MKTSFKEALNKLASHGLMVEVETRRVSTGEEFVSMPLNDFLAIADKVASRPHATSGPFMRTDRASGR